MYNIFVFTMPFLTSKGVADRNVSLCSLSSFMAFGIAILLVNHKTKTRQRRYESQLTRMLWKFVPESDVKDRYDENCWNWRKLVLAGGALASMSVALSVKRLNSLKSLMLGGILFFIWVIFLIIFWYFDVMGDAAATAGGENKSSSAATTVKGEKDKKEKAESPLNKGVLAGGWEDKLKVKRIRASSSSLSSSSLSKQHQQPQTEDDNRLPVTIITGFLGSGKTTLVKSILHNTVGMKVLVIENEIGAEGIDHELLMQHTAKEEIVLLNNGCVCCTVRNDLLKTFHRMFKDDSFSRLDWVVIETTGIADPAPLIQSLYMDEGCKRHMRLDSVLTVVDCKHLPIHLARDRAGEKGAHGGAVEARLQLAYADRILLNKTDLVSQEELQAVALAVNAVNPSAPRLHGCLDNPVPIEQLLNIRAFDATKNAVSLLAAESSSQPAGDIEGPFVIRRDAKGNVIRNKNGVRVWKSNASPSSSKNDGISGGGVVQGDDDVGTGKGKGGEGKGEGDENKPPPDRKTGAVCTVSIQTDDALGLCLATSCLLTII